MTRRLVALLVLATLATPWATVCLPGESGAMPCCVKSHADQPPVVRACCGAKDSAPATPRSAPALQLPATAPSSLTCVTVLDTSASLVRAQHPSRPSRTDIRLLNAVFLI
jgi:hypothetical protein